MEKIGGNTSVDGSIGYCNQQAWIQNATLKDNVISFGSNEFDKKRYNKILEVNINNTKKYFCEIEMCSYRLSELTNFLFYIQIVMRNES